MEHRIYHWRRHDGLAAGLNGLRGIDVVASACGRLVDYQQAVKDAAETNCPDCAVIATAIGEKMEPFEFGGI